jgi:hypothetical protein
MINFILASTVAFMVLYPSAKRIKAGGKMFRDGQQLLKTGIQTLIDEHNASPTIHPSISRAYLALSPEAIPNNQVAMGSIKYIDDSYSLNVFPDWGLERLADVCYHLFYDVYLAALGLP